MTHSIGRRVLAPGAAAAWMMLLIGADCGGYYPDFPAQDSGTFFGTDGFIDASPEAFVDTSRPVASTPFWDIYIADRTAAEAPQLAIDSAGVLHLALVRPDSGEVVALSGSPCHFTSETAGHQDPLSHAGLAQVLASDGALHLVFARDTRGGTTYAIRDASGTWSSRLLPLAGAPDGTSSPALALAPDGSAVVVGAEAASGARVVVRAIDVGGATAIDAPSDQTATSLSVVVAPDGTAHAAFTIDGSPPTFVLATRLASGWVTRTLLGRSGGALALDAAGLLHVAYIQDRDVIHTTRGADVPAGADAIAFHDMSTADGPSRVSMAIDAHDIVHLAFADGLGVHYATDRTGAWTVEDIDGGIDPVVSLDASGVPWIVFSDTYGQTFLAHRGHVTDR